MRCPRSHPIPGAVDDIQFLSVELRVEYGGEYRVSILLLYGEIVGNCVAGIYRAATRLSHHTRRSSIPRGCGLLSPFDPEKGYVFDFLVGLINLHLIWDLNCFAFLQRDFAGSDRVLWQNRTQFSKK